MRISVIVPTYNRKEDLRECLMSVLVQQLPPAEIFVIDNAKLKETEEVVNNLKNSFNMKGIEISYIENLMENSLTVARNFGATLCGGDVVSFLDDDVILDEDYYKKMEKMEKLYESLKNN